MVRIPKHHAWVFGERETAPVVVVVYNQRALSSHDSCMSHNSSGLSLAGKKLHQQATKTTTFDGPSGMGWGEVVSTQMAQIKRTNNSELTKQQTLNIKMQNRTREIRDFFLIQFSCLCFKEKGRTILKH